MTATLQTTNIQNAASSTTNLALDTSGNVTVGSSLTAANNITATSGTVVMASSFLRNRIINGGMQIDQRNAGAAVTLTGASFTYLVDRFYAGVASGGAFSAGQNKNAVTPPAGFTNYLGFATTTAKTPAAGDYFYLQQPIEGFNASDLAYGTASAKSITISFWVYSNLTGTFGLSLGIGSVAAAYVTSYTISSANTWTFITITIPGNTSTALTSTTNGVGLRLSWDLGCGSTYQGTANTWSGYSGPSDRYTVAGTQQVIASTSNYWYITGVQLEVGSVATPFERRLYGQELMLCQRYFEMSYDQGTAPGATTTNGMAVGYFPSGVSGNNVRFPVKFAVVKRTVPTMSYWDGAGNASKETVWSGSNAQTNNVNGGSQGFFNLGTSAFAFNDANLGGYYTFGIHWTASAEL